MFNSALLSAHIYAGKNLPPPTPPREGLSGGWVPLGRVAPCNELYGESPLERATFFRMEVYERVGISQAEV